MFVYNLFLGPNILLARLATRKAKPNGQYQVTVTEAKDFIKDQPVRNLPGKSRNLIHVEHFAIQEQNLLITWPATWFLYYYCSHLKYCLICMFKTSYRVKGIKF